MPSATPLGIDLDDTDKAIMLGVIDRLTPAHLAVLRRLADPHVNRSRTFMDFVAQEFPDLAQREVLARRIWKNIETDEELLKSGTLTLTDYGKRFLEFVSTPKL